MSFRLSQNEDGSYSVFNSTTKTFLCNIPSSKNPAPKSKVQVSLIESKKRKFKEDGDFESNASEERGPRRHGLRTRPDIAYRECDEKASLGNSSLQKLPRNESFQNGQESQRSSTKRVNGSSKLSSIYNRKLNILEKKPKYDAPPSSPEPEEDCIDTSSFMRMVNLIPSNKFVSASDVRDSRHRFPIRRISRVSPKSSSRLQQCNYTILELVEDLDICTLNQSCIYPFKSCEIDKITLSKCIINYERHCQTTEACALVRNKGPGHQLRARDSLHKFNVTYRSPKNEEKKSYHFYSFSVRQRLQRYQRLKTGLSKHSTMLLKHCKKRIPIVKLERLSQKTIDKHLAQVDSSFNCGKSEALSQDKGPSLPKRILQPVITEVLTNQTVAPLRHPHLQSDLMYIFGKQKTAEDETRFNKVQDWLNLVENCSPKNSVSKELKPKRRERGVANGNGLQTNKTYKSVMGSPRTLSNWLPNSDNEEQYYYNNFPSSPSSPVMEILKQDSMINKPRNVTTCNGNGLLNDGNFPKNKGRFVQKLSKHSLNKNGL